MYAVIETGGKQYRVSPGQTVEVELLPAEPGSEVALESVLLVATDEKTLVGAPAVAGARVMTTVVREGRGEKIIVFKYQVEEALSPDAGPPPGLHLSDRDRHSGRRREPGSG